MRTFTRQLPSWHLPALGAAVAVLLVAGLVAVPIAGDDDADAPSATQDVTAGRAGGRSSGPKSGAAGSDADTDAGGTEQDAADVAAGDDPAAPGEGPGDGAAGTATGAPGGAGGGGGQAAGGGGAPLRATDQGVSPDAIKLGIMILNVGNVEKLGIAVGVSPEQQQQAWRAYVDQLNEQGGINGRQVKPVFHQYDVLSNDSQRAACLAMTEDHKVFAVLDIALTTANALCITHEHETPLVTLQPMPEEAYAKSQGRLFTLFAAGHRMWRNVANDLHDRGALRGKTIGILGDTAPGNPQTIDTFEAELRSLGYEVAHRSKLTSDGSAATLPQAGSEIPIEVQAMRREGVDLVFLFTGNYVSNQFVQHADGQGWRPAYVATDWNNAYSDTYVQNMPPSFDGSLITTNRTGEFRRNLPEPETEAACRKTVEERTGEKLDRSTVQYNSTVRLCTLLDVFVRGATAAGADLTRPALSEGIHGIGPMPLATFGGGSFRPGKPDAGDLIRTARFDSECRCWIPADGFRPPKHA
jgi:ABC-type branched-subunit amino acid transport system substrate-binding protein